MVEGGTADDPGIVGFSGLVELGRSAAATTYGGQDASGKTVVVKVLQREAVAEVRARFDYDQARLAELREHPDIVVTLDHGYTAANQPYLVTEELTGGSMADRVGSGMDGPGVLAIGVKLAGALESAHRRNLIHGDLRPEDVLVTDDGEPHIADLGVALVAGLGPDRATDPARIAHAAPEQLETHLPTPATDVYALGSVLYTLLAGTSAFVRPGDTSALAVALRIAHEPAPDLRPTGVPGAVIDVIDRALAKNPADRWPSAEAMGHALQQAEVTLGLPITPMTVIGADLNPPRPEAEVTDVAARATLAATGPWGGGSKKPWLIGAGVLAVVAIGGFLAFGGDDDGDDPRPTPLTRPEREDIDLVVTVDDTGTINVSVIERWDDVDGRNLEVADGVLTPDLIAAEDVDGFLSADGFGVSGIEVTFLEADALAAAGLPTDAGGLLGQRVSGRNLANQCSTDLPPAEAELGGFDGVRQRFEGCDGSTLEVFAGVDGNGQGLVIEAHLVNDEDENAIELVLESISIS